MCTLGSYVLLCCWHVLTLIAPITYTTDVVGGVATLKQAITLLVSDSRVMDTIFINGHRTNGQCSAVLHCLTPVVGGGWLIHHHKVRWYQLHPLLFYHPALQCWTYDGA